MPLEITNEVIAHQPPEARAMMPREFETVDAAEMLGTAFRRFQTCHCETLPILRAGALVGLASLDNVGEFVAVQAPLESAQASRRKAVGA
jgi:hypothetical protein